jgi:hypothetical protein
VPRPDPPKLQAQKNTRARVRASLNSGVLIPATDVAAAQKKYANTIEKSMQLRAILANPLRGCAGATKNKTSENLNSAFQILNIAESDF